MSGNPISKRRQLGEAIAFLRDDLGISKHQLADKTRVTIKIVDAWESGDQVPTAQEWQRMRSIFPSLAPASYKLRDLYQSAAAEQLAFEQAKESAEAKDEEGKNEFSAAVHLLVESIPNLRSMMISITDDGEVSVSYKTREVRVVEDGGSLKIKIR